MKGSDCAYFKHIGTNQSTERTEGMVYHNIMITCKLIRVKVLGLGFRLGLVPLSLRNSISSTFMTCLTLRPG